MAVKVRTANPILPEEDKIKIALQTAKSNNLIFIPGEVPSSKNHFASVSGKGGKKKLVYTDFTRRYIASTQWYYNMFARDFLVMAKGKDFPLRVDFHLFRRTRQTFDYLNIGQIIQDMMKKHGWIPDDDSKHLVPSFTPAVHNKDLFGVYIKIK